IAEGPKIVAELLQLAPQQIVTVYATREWMTHQRGIPPTAEVIEISPQELERISQLDTPHDVLAIARQFDAWAPVGKTFTLYLDTIQDPGNMGTIIRIADWFGVPSIVCSPGCADVYNPKVVQASMASLARVNVFADTGEDWLQQQDVAVYAAMLKGDSVYEIEPVSTGILLLGNESKGVRSHYLSQSVKKITIPRRGHAESLNVSVAAGIILSHLLR
ncbi:MAG TPA: RNA methyltransferase, partial [Flavisolibacter sp.]